MRHVEHVMGTVFSFDVPGGAPMGPVVAWLHHVDAVFSPYRPDSPVSRLARGELEPAGCPAEVTEVLALCAQAEHDSDGYFTVFPFGRFDPSGLVKGWAIDRAAALLRESGARCHSVNGGGDVRLGAAPGRPWRVGVAHPLRPGRLATVVTGSDLAVATSGTAERGPHICDPRTGSPATGLASITLVGPRLTTVDAYATAAFAMGPVTAREWVEAMDGLEAFAVLPSGSTWQTSGFAAFTA
ncbi:FAD:protein FMN transferase [Actinomadura sp. ATCC 31491]|uniref:FAD:protein FMN transferase n=1 Tax=Actinomadura luzonensis TaxID=2805427 RepID=A0ABT0FUR5_9ACTN|nr:FAD:protein FMN transferase [Actinomadura luzonensis]MCK2216083.1 FAD:protein FMN transferase [Actinomadura luzonensis]